MGAVGVAGFVIATAHGEVTWPFEVFCGVGAISFLAGTVIYRASGYEPTRERSVGS